MIFILIISILFWLVIALICLYRPITRMIEFNQKTEGRIVDETDEDIHLENEDETGVYLPTVDMYVVEYFAGEKKRYLKVFKDDTMKSGDKIQVLHSKENFDKAILKKNLQKEFLTGFFTTLFFAIIPIIIIYAMIMGKSN